MKIVIDIPEKYYKEIKDNYFGETIGLLNIMIMSIVNGIPLPKGHGRIVDIGPYEGKVIVNRIYCGINSPVEVAELDTIIEADKEEEE